MTVGRQTDSELNGTCDAQIPLPNLCSIQFYLTNSTARFHVHLILHHRSLPSLIMGATRKHGIQVCGERKAALGAACYYLSGTEKWLLVELP